MFQVLSILSLVSISICRFPNAFPIHATFFEIARISHSNLPQIPANSLKFIVDVHTFVVIAILEVLFPLSMFHPLLETPAIPAYICGQLTNSLVLVVFPSSFVLDPVAVTNHPLSMLLVSAELAFEDILLRHYLNALALLC